LVKKELIRIYQNQSGELLIPSRTKSYHDIKITPKWLLPVTFRSVMIYLTSFWCYREILKFLDPWLLLLEYEKRRVLERIKETVKKFLILVSYFLEKQNEFRVLLYCGIIGITCSKKPKSFFPFYCSLSKKCNIEKWECF